MLQNRIIRSRYLSLAAYMAVGYGLVLWRAGWGNYTRASGPILIGFVLATDALLRALRRPQRVLWRILSALGLGCCGVLLAGFTFLAAVLEDEGTGSLGVVWRPAQQVHAERAPIRCYPTEAVAIDHIVETVQTLVPPDAPIFVIPYMPLFYYLCARENPTYYEWIIPGTFPDAESKRTALTQFAANPPPALIYQDVAIDGDETRRFSKFAPRWERFINRHYRVLTKMSGLMVLFYDQQPVEADLISWLYRYSGCELSGNARIDASLEGGVPQRWLELHDNSGFRIAQPPGGILRFTAEPLLPNAQPTDESEVIVWLANELETVEIWRSALPRDACDVQIAVPADTGARYLVLHVTGLGRKLVEPEIVIPTS